MARPPGDEAVSSVEDDCYPVVPGFREPKWLGKGERRHIPDPGMSWNDAIASSEGKEGDAWYHPDLGLSEIESIEMDSVRDRNEIPRGRKPHQRVYWRHIGRIIGASKGKLTEYVYVFWNGQGEVHGLPITPDELKRKGVKL